MIERFIANSNRGLETFKEINRDFILFKGSVAGSTEFPLDLTPENTYGKQIMQFVYKPISNNSIIEISPVISIRTEQQAENRGIFAVFINDNLYSQGGVFVYLPYADSGAILYGSASYNNNSFDSVTIKVRAGLCFTPSNFTFNPYLNGHTSSSLMIKEFIK